MARKPPRPIPRYERDAIFAAAPGLETAAFLFDSISDILFCIKDRSRRYVAVNDAFVRRAGLRRRSDVLGKTARELFPAILAAGYEQQDDDLFSTDAPVRDRLEMITQPQGEFGWFVSQKIPITSSAGQVIALAGISRDLATPASRGADLGALAPLLDTLHRNCNEPLRIESLAKKSGLSWSQFQRRVRSITGLSPRQLLTKSRIESAAQLLQTTDLPLSAIAMRTGFYDQPAFTRQFHTATGLTPSAYRKTLRSPE